MCPGRGYCALGFPSVLNTLQGLHGKSLCHHCQSCFSPSIPMWMPNTYSVTSHSLSSVFIQNQSMTSYIWCSEKAYYSDDLEMDYSLSTWQ